MFKAKIKTDKLIEMLGALSALVSEAKIKIGPDGISTKAVDPANVAMVSLKLSSDAFESFEATKGELGIDITRISNLMDMAQKDAEIGLELDKTNLKLIMNLGGGLQYRVSLLAPSEIMKEPKTGIIDYPVHVVMRGEDLWRGIKAAESIHDYLWLGTTEECFYIEAEDNDKLRFELTKDQQIEYATSETKTMFSIEYIRDISKFASKKDAVTLGIKTDYPLTIGFKIADGKGEVSYMIAPRVESA